MGLQEAVLQHSAGRGRDPRGALSYQRGAGLPAEQAGLMLITSPHASPFISRGMQEQCSPDTQRYSCHPGLPCQARELLGGCRSEAHPFHQQQDPAPLSATEGQANTEQLGLTQLPPVG